VDKWRCKKKPGTVYATRPLRDPVYLLGFAFNKFSMMLTLFLLSQDSREDDALNSLTKLSKNNL